MYHQNNNNKSRFKQRNEKGQDLVYINLYESLEKAHI
jgi:hypothetical protein